MNKKITARNISNPSYVIKAKPKPTKIAPIILALNGMSSRIGEKKDIITQITAIVCNPGPHTKKSNLGFKTLSIYMAIYGRFFHMANSFS